MIIANGIGVPFSKGGGGPSVNTDFVTVWETENPGSATKTITLPLNSGFAYSGTIDWGDGTSDDLTYANRTHVYSTTGTKTITISSDALYYWQFLNSGDRRKLVDVQNWGEYFRLVTRGFQGANNMVISATDAPTINSSLESALEMCDALTNEDFTHWDLSGTTSLQNCFNDCDNFVGDINNWVHSGITTIRNMMKGCHKFNGDVNNWDTSGITNWFEGFRDCDLFNGNVSGWVLNGSVYNVFNGCHAFTGNGCNTWNVSGVTSLESTFANCDVFNSDISGWNVSNVTNVKTTFQSCKAFNQNLGAWNMTGVTSIYRMFYNADVFNNGGSDTIKNWDTSDVTNMQETFRGAHQFNQDIDDWDTSSVTTMRGMFWDDDAFAYSLNSWDTSSVTTMQEMFRDCLYNQNISSWNVSSVTTFHRMFQNNTAFNQNIGSWNTSSGTNLSFMLYNGDAFNQDISSWDVNQVTSLTSFMQNATGLSTANYDALLIAWDAQGAMSFSGTANFGGAQYTGGGAAATAHASLVTKWGGITDGGIA